MPQRSRRIVQCGGEGLRSLNLAPHYRRLDRCGYWPACNREYDGHDCQRRHRQAPKPNQPPTDAAICARGFVKICKAVHRMVPPARAIPLQSTANGATLLVRHGPGCPATGRSRRDVAWPSWQATEASFSSRAIVVASAGFAASRALFALPMPTTDLPAASGSKVPRGPASRRQRRQAIPQFGVASQSWGAVAVGALAAGLTRAARVCPVKPTSCLTTNCDERRDSQQRPDSAEMRVTTSRRPHPGQRHG
mmetsp:Transcript_276/g.644  ORF Transcript_276/g.644 Transcript_276/m.644 type:complete len:250 (-) Transcript_276:36-785(-)